MALTDPGLAIDDIVNLLNLEPHPEGGFYAQTFIDPNTISMPDMPSRSASTMIYFLLTPSSFSRIHRLDVSEAWHHYAGLPINVVELAHTGALVTRLGKDLARGERPQHVVRDNRWFGSVMADVLKGDTDGDGTKWSLVGCTVAPGFEWTRFEMGDRAKLIIDFESCREWVERLTPDNKP